MADFSPGRGSVQRGIRPALIIQNDVGNQYAATTIVAVNAAIQISLGGGIAY
jgi:mRNA interferase MazF